MNLSISVWANASTRGASHPLRKPSSKSAWSLKRHWNQVNRAKSPLCTKISRKWSSFKLSKPRWSRTCNNSWCNKKPKTKWTKRKRFPNTRAKNLFRPSRLRKPLARSSQTITRLWSLSNKSTNRWKRLISRSQRRTNLIKKDTWKWTKRWENSKRSTIMSNPRLVRQLEGTPKTSLHSPTSQKSKSPSMSSRSLRQSTKWLSKWTLATNIQVWANRTPSRS